MAILELGGGSYQGTKDRNRFYQDTGDWTEIDQVWPLLKLCNRNADSNIFDVDSVFRKSVRL